MSEKKKHQPPRAGALGNDPFADMDTLEWLGIESPPAPEPEISVPPETDIIPVLNLPNDEAERALQEWLREEMPPESPSDEETPTPDAQAQLLARLLAEQEAK